MKPSEDGTLNALNMVFEGWVCKQLMLLVNLRVMKSVIVWERKFGRKRKEKKKRIPRVEIQISKHFRVNLFSGNFCSRMVAFLRVCN